MLSPSCISVIEEVKQTRLSDQSSDLAIPFPMPQQAFSEMDLPSDSKLLSGPRMSVIGKIPKEANN